MKSLGWLLLLTSLVFGIGWKSSSLARSGALEGARGPVPHFGGPGEPPDGRGRHHGPRLGSTEELADQLDLSADQRAALAAMVEASAEAIRAHERAIWELKNAGRSTLRDLLTEAQSTRLTQLLDERFQAFCREQTSAQVDWFKEQAPALAPDQLAGVEAVITRYEEGKRVLFGGPGAPEPGAARPFDGDQERTEVDARVAAMRQERDDQLRALLGAELLERFQTQRRRGGGRRSSFRMHESPDSPMKEEH